MNAQRFIYLILTISVLLFFTACNEAEDSVPTEVATESTSSEQVATTIESNDIDFISPSIEETVSSLDYTLPDDDIVIENTSAAKEDTPITTYISTPDENVTSPAPDENVTTPPEEEIIIYIEYTTGFVGKLIDSFVSGVDYTCDANTKKTDYLGRFNCQTTPVEFSIGNISLGSIEYIPDDYLVFPQDLLSVQRGAALHPEVTKMAVLFQSLDDDANPDNGIVINQEVISLLNQEFMHITSIQDITLAQLTLGIENVIQNHLQNNPLSQLQLVAVEQAQDHLLKSLSTILLSPVQP